MGPKTPNGHEYKPETLARLRAEREAARAARKADTARRLRAKADQEGPDSIWAEMAKEADA